WGARHISIEEAQRSCSNSKRIPLSKVCRRSEGHCFDERSSHVSFHCKPLLRPSPKLAFGWGARNAGLSLERAGSRCEDERPPSRWLQGRRDAAVPRDLPPPWLWRRLQRVEESRRR